MTPLNYYHKQCREGLIVEDQQQLMALQHFQKIAEDLVQEHKTRAGFFALLRKPKLVQGLYLWGGVGIGKTFLMDCFYHSLSFQQKTRMHFHQFMQFVHQELKKHQGKKNPLQIIATELAQNNLVLCFDELFVSEIVDAMLLARLFHALFLKGVCLVATSNVMPDDLYKKGLQRPLFLPAIELLKQHTNVVHLPTEVDYRLRHLKNAGVFYTPNDGVANEKMEKSFAVLANDHPISYDSIEVCGRPIKINKQTNDIIWFDFNEICTIPRSQQDYLAIAEKYRTVFISHVPIIPYHSKNTISLFIRLVDVFYDARVRLILSAVEKVDKIYSQGSMLFEYGRTQSRLLEMQSESYFFNTIR